MSMDAGNPFLIPSILENLGKVCKSNDLPELKNLRQTSSRNYDLLNPSYFDLLEQGIKFLRIEKEICSYSETLKTVCIVKDLREDPEPESVSSGVVKDELWKNWDPSIAHTFRKLRLEFLPMFPSGNTEIKGLNVMELISQLYPYIVKIILVKTPDILENRGDKLLDFFLNFEILKEIIIEVNSEWRELEIAQLNIVVAGLKAKGVKVDLRIKSVQLLKLIIEQGLIRPPQIISLHLTIYVMDRSVKLESLANLILGNASKLIIPYMHVHIYLSPEDIGTQNPIRIISNLGHLSPYITRLTVDECSMDIFTTMNWANLTHLTLNKVEFPLPILTEFRFPKIEYLILSELRERENSLYLSVGGQTDEENLSLIFEGCSRLKELKICVEKTSKIPRIVQNKHLYNYLQGLLPNTNILNVTFDSAASRI